MIAIIRSPHDLSYLAYKFLHSDDSFLYLGTSFNFYFTLCKSECESFIFRCSLSNVIALAANKGFPISQQNHVLRAGIINYTEWNRDFSFNWNNLTLDELKKELLKFEQFLENYATCDSLVNAIIG